MQHPSTLPPAGSPNPADAHMAAALAACDLLRDTAELPGEPGELLAVLSRHRHALLDLLRSDPAGALALKITRAQGREQSPAVTGQRAPDASIGRELSRLSAAYPQFTFSHEAFRRDGARWIAQRRDGLARGLHTVITADLAELHAALADDRARHGRCRASKTQRGAT